MLTFTESNLLYAPSEYAAQYSVPESKLRMHNGQLKLFLSEVLFFERYVDLSQDEVHVIYAGAAPGQHIPMLARMYPNVHFHLYDPSPFAIAQTDRIEVVQLPFTDALADKLRDKYDSVYFISDIRRSPGKVSHIEREVYIGTDMMMQKGWHERLRPEFSLLKFRLPLPDYSTGIQLDPYARYLDGDLYRQGYAPNNSTELRLVAPKDAEEVGYNSVELDTSMAYYNSIQRRQTEFANPILPVLQRFGYATDKNERSVKLISRKTLPLSLRARIRRALLPDGSVDPAFINDLEYLNGRSYDEAFLITVLGEYFANPARNQNKDPTPVATLRNIERLVSLLLDDFESLRAYSRIQYYNLGERLEPRAQFDLQIASTYLAQIQTAKTELSRLTKQYLLALPTKNTLTRALHLYYLGENGLPNRLTPSLSASREMLLAFIATSKDKSDLVATVYRYLLRNEDLISTRLPEVGETRVHSGMSDESILRVALFLLQDQAEVIRASFTPDVTDALLSIDEIDSDDLQGVLLSASQQMREKGNLLRVNEQLLRVFTELNTAMSGVDSVKVQINNKAPIDSRFYRFEVRIGNKRAVTTIFGEQYDQLIAAGFTRDAIVMRLVLNDELYGGAGAGFNRSIDANVYETIMSLLSPSSGNFASFEMYADMFNSFGPNFASMFPEVDRALANPMDTVRDYSRPLVVEANPPYLPEYIDDFLDKTKQMMQRDAPTSIVLFLPEIDPTVLNRVMTDDVAAAITVANGKYLMSGKEYELAHTANYEGPVRIVLYQNEKSDNANEIVNRIAESIDTLR